MSFCSIFINFNEGGSSWFFRRTPSQLWTANTLLSELGEANCFTHLLETEWTCQKSRFDWYRCLHSNEVFQQFSAIFSTYRPELLKRPIISYIYSPGVDRQDCKVYKNSIRAFSKKKLGWIFSSKKLQIGVFFHCSIGTSVFLTD